MNGVGVATALVADGVRTVEVEVEVTVEVDLLLVVEVVHCCQFEVVTPVPVGLMEVVLAAGLQPVQMGAWVVVVVWEIG